MSFSDQQRRFDQHVANNIRLEREAIEQRWLTVGCLSTDHCWRRLDDTSLPCFRGRCTLKLKVDDDSHDQWRELNDGGNLP